MSNTGTFTSQPIRRKLLILLAFIFTPAAGVIILSGLNHRSDAIRAMENNALLVVQSLAAQQEQVTTGTKQMLETLAQLPVVQNTDANACNHIFRELNNQHPFYSIMAAVTPDGNMFAASIPFEPDSMSLSDRKHIRDAIRTLDFSVGEFITGRVSKVQSLNYSYPVFDKNMNLAAILVAAFKLDEYARFLEKVKLPEGYVLTIQDYRGVRLYRLPEHEAAAPGMPIPREVFEIMSADLDHGILDRMGADGIDRVYAFKRLHLIENSPAYLYMTIGLAKDKIFHEANLEMLRNLAILGIAALAAMFLAWVIGNFIFVDPIKKLVNAVQRFGNGELRTRTCLPHSPDELGQLAKAFDEMASLLEMRSIGRMRAEEELQKAHEELEAKVAFRTTDLARAIESLRESAWFWQQLIDTLPVPVFYKDSDGLYLGCNKSFENFLNVRKDQIVGKSVFEIAPKELADVYHEKDLALLKTPGAQIYEATVEDANGYSHDMIFHKATFFNADGSIGGVIGAAVDITEHKRAENAMRKSEERYHQIAECVPDLVWTMDLSGRFTYANSAIKRNYGYTVEEFLELTFHDTCTPEYAVQHQATIEEGLAKAASPQYDRSTIRQLISQQVRKDGSTFWAAVSAGFLWSDDGKPVGIIGVTRDVTEGRRAEEILRESAELHSAIVNQATEGIVMVDCETLRFAEFSDAACNGLGYSREEFARLTLFDVQGRLTREEFTETFRAVMETGHARFENQHRRKDGSVRDVKINSQIISLRDRKYLVGVWLDITEQKRAEDALKRGEEKYRELVQNANSIILGMDNMGNVTFINEFAQRFFGYGEEEILGKNVVGTIVPPAETSSRDLRLLIEDIALNPNRYASNVSENMRRDGERVWIAWTNKPIRYENGRVSEILCVGNDITERKWAEDALKESQQRLADIIDFLPDATLVIDREGIVIAWNRAIEEMTGVKAADILGKGNYEYALPFYGKRRPILIDLALQSLPEIEEKYEGLAKTPTVISGQAFMQTLRGGGRVYLFGKASPLFDSRGNIVGAIEAIRDITERKLMEEAVADAETRYRNIFENALMGIYQSTPEGRFLNLNMAFARILGYDSPEEVLNTINDAKRLYVPHERRNELLRQVEERGMVNEFEAKVLKKDKSVAWITINMRAVRDNDGKIIHLEGTIQDITERKQLETQLLQAQKLEAIGTLAGGIAHDFNNILMPIIGFSELSLKEVPQDSRLHGNLEQILLSSERAKDLVKQILTFSRKREQESKPVRISLLVKETLHLLRSTLPSTIEIRQSLDSDAMDSTIMADPVQIHQVLMNLCTNAYHAMRARGGVLSIALGNVDFQSGAGTPVAELEPGAYLKLTVADTGHGIDGASIHRIFDPYFTTKGPLEGTGLGLATVYGIVKSLNGGIAVFSKPGEGTAFDVYFPRTKVIQVLASDVSPPLPMGKGLVLLVDDERSIVDMLKEMLESLGYEVAERYSSLDALQAFKANPQSYDLVITDLTMPHMTGTDLAKEILKIRADTPIILCTGFSEAVNENRAKLMGIKGFLMKPMALRDLAVAVNKALKRT